MWNNLRQDIAVYNGNFGNRGLWVMIAYRFGQWRYEIPWSPIRKPFSLAYKALKLLSEILTGVELPCETVVGSRLRIEHVGDIVVSGDARLGDDVILRNGVTSASTFWARNSRPASPLLRRGPEQGAGDDFHSYYLQVCSRPGRRNQCRCSVDD